MSPIWGVQVDYSQFAPRGRYTENDFLKRYFKTLRYASTVLFAFNPSAATGVDEKRATANAAMAADMVARLQVAPLSEVYQSLDHVLSWQFGPEDDLSLSDVAKVVASEASKDEALHQRLVEYAVGNDRVPKIIGGVVDVNGLEAQQSANEVLIGWRLLPARFSSQTGAMQQLVFNGGSEELLLDCSGCEEAPVNASLIVGRQVKGYPSYLEILSILGSEKAAAELDSRNMRAYSGYEVKAKNADQLLREATGLEAMQIQLMTSIVEDANFDEAAAGFWVWQKYLNLLYQKQSYTVQGKSLNFSQSTGDRSGAWLLGSVANYEALSQLVTQHVQNDANEKWKSFVEVITRCIDVAKKIEVGMTLSQDDDLFLNNIDLDLVALGAGEDLPVVVDIHTNAADNKVVEVGTTYPIVKNYKNARGAVFSVREFYVELEKRLTVDIWREVLASMESANVDK